MENDAEGYPVRDIILVERVIFPSIYGIPLGMQPVKMLQSTACCEVGYINKCAFCKKIL